MVLAGGRSSVVLGAEPAVDRQPGADALGRLPPKLWTTPREQDASRPTVTTGTLSLRSVTARFSPPGLPRSIRTDRGLSRLDPGQDPLEPRRSSGRRTPARGLEVGQEDDFLLADRGGVQHVVDLLECGRQIGPPCGDRQLADLFLHLVQVVRGVADDDPRRVGP